MHMELDTLILALLSDDSCQVVKVFSHARHGDDADDGLKLYLVHGQQSPDVYEDCANISGTISE